MGVHSTVCLWNTRPPFLLVARQLGGHSGGGRKVTAPQAAVAQALPETALLGSPPMYPFTATHTVLGLDLPPSLPTLRVLSDTSDVN